VRAKKWPYRGFSTARGPKFERRMNMADLSVTFAGIKFKNPLIASSAPPTKNVEGVIRAVKAGIGGIVPKTINFEERTQTRPHPLYYRHNWRTIDSKDYQERIPQEASLVARDILCSYSPEEFMPIIREMKKVTQAENVVLIGSVMGRTVDEWVQLSEMMDRNGVDMIELDFSCPSTPLWSKELSQGALEVAQSPDAIRVVVGAVKKAVNVPVVSKLTFQTNSPSHIAAAVKEAGGDAVTLFNIIHGLLIDIETGSPVHGVHYASGVFSGSYIQPFVLRWIAKTYAEVGIPISGSWGVQTWKNVVEYMMAGAGTVQFCSAIMLVGYRLITHMLAGLNKFMDEKGYRGFDEIIGRVHDEMISSYAEYDRVQPVLSAQVVEEKCTVCGICTRVCMYKAISLDKESARVAREKCIGCTACHSICPEDAVHMEQGDEETYLRALKYSS
jgi:dihydroorotate dehydrogenase subfamily 1